ncbi:unnamed protein product [Arabidopsis halleri]
MIQSEAKSLAMNELSSFEFLLSTIIWFDILHVVNMVSKKLQSKDMQTDVAMTEVSGLISYLKNYRKTGFVDAMTKAKEIAIEIGIEPIFIQRRVIRRKKQYDETSGNETVLSVEETFRIQYFLYIIDHAICSLDKRFDQYRLYENIFGFLFDSTKLKMCDDVSLKSHCTCLENSLKNGDLLDINGDELFLELKFLVELLPNEKMGACEILNFLEQFDSFPYTTIALRILLTIPITVASAERSFSKLMLLKSHLRASMSQDRLNGLALMAIENNFLEELDCETLIDDFAADHVQKKAIFT